MAGARGNYHPEIRLSREQVATLKIALGVAEHESQITKQQHDELITALGGPLDQVMGDMEKAAYERDAYLATDFYYEVIEPTEEAKPYGIKSTIVIMTKWEFEREDFSIVSGEGYFRPPWPNEIEIDEYMDGFSDTTTEPENARELMSAKGFEWKEGLAERVMKG